MSFAIRTLALLSAAALIGACGDAGAPQPAPANEPTPEQPAPEQPAAEQPQEGTPPGHNPYEGLFEILDLADPVAVGDPATYVIEVWNPGSADSTNVEVAVTLPPEQDFVSAEGPDGIAHQVDARVVRFRPVARIAPGQRATFQVVAKAVAAGDVTVTAEMTSDAIMGRPARVTETTQQH